MTPQDLKAAVERVRPVRVQLKRSEGWRMPPNTVKVDRGTGWGNPWFVGPGRVKLHSGEVVQIGPTLTAAGAVDRFRRWMAGEFGYGIGGMVRHPLLDLVLCPGAPPSPRFLEGQNLACWCKPGEPCHADVLLELANPAEPGLSGRQGSGANTSAGNPATDELQNPNNHRGES